jgi:hypothetical protein
MTTERPESRQASVKISVNATGEAQVEVLVYADSSVPKFERINEIKYAAAIAANAQYNAEREIRQYGGRVAGDAVKGGA